MRWDEEKQVLMTCAKDKSFKIWQFPLIWVDEQNVDLQRAPDVAAARAKSSAKGAANGSASKQRPDYDESDDSDDDGLGRIKSKPSKNALPAGLGSMFNKNNPLAAGAQAAAAQHAE